MLSKSADEVVANFEKKFENDEFPIVKLANSGVNYNNSAQERDSTAVKNFTKSDIFNFVMHGRKH